MANIFWRFEDLWQSPTGDISHAVKHPVGRALRPPEIPVYRPDAVSVSTGGIGTRNLRVLWWRVSTLPQLAEAEGARGIPDAMLLPAQQLTAAIRLRRNR